MSAFAHSRTPSTDTTSSGSSYQLILEHILAYPGTYEIPLRTMYTLNCAPRAQPLPLGLARSTTPASSTNTSPTVANFPFQDQQQATAQFTTSLMAQISQLPAQPCSLPPAFVTSFVQRCFPPELPMVDFPQALTALDYLKDLETRRRKEVAASLSRLGIDRNSLGSEVDELARRYPGVAVWVRALEEKEKRVDAYYTGLWVALRRWVLINEMSLVPFNKHNCHAMLNTLYPPVASAQPNSKLTPAMLTNQRDGFFKYIKAVEQRGPGVLGNLIKQNKQPGDETGWPEVERTLEKYLRLANSIITESQEVNSVDYFGYAEELEKRKGKKTDSGVSFSSASSTRPSTGDSFSGSKKSPPPTPSKGGSTLERI
ncbi:hypothetical protein LTS18_006467, partial [Coniosporium uncinatum]